MITGAERLKELFLAAFLGAALTVVGHFMILGRNVVTRAEMQQYVSENGPYARDSQYIRQRLDDIASGITRLPDIERRLARVEAVLEARK